MIPTSHNGRPVVHLDHGPGKIHGYYLIVGRCRCGTCRTTSLVAYTLEKYEPNVAGKPAMVTHSLPGEHFRVVQTMEAELHCVSVPCNGIHVTQSEMDARERETQTIGKVR